MTEAEELAYDTGSRVAWLSVLQQALKELGRDSKEWSAARWVMERETTINMLRIVCDRFGDNNWPDDLHLSDIIEKHLARHLEVKP